MQLDKLTNRKPEMLMHFIDADKIYGASNYLPVFFFIKFCVVGIDIFWYNEQLLLCFHVSDFFVFFIYF